MVLVLPSPSHHLFWQHLCLTLSFSLFLHTHRSKIQTFFNLSDCTIVQLQNSDLPRSKSMLLALRWSWNSPILVQPMTTVAAIVLMLFRTRNQAQRDSPSSINELVGDEMAIQCATVVVAMRWRWHDWRWMGVGATVLVRWWLWWSEDQKRMENGGVIVVMEVEERRWGLRWSWAKDGMHDGAWCVAIDI